MNIFLTELIQHLDEKNALSIFFLKMEKSFLSLQYYGNLKNFILFEFSGQRKV